MISPEMAKEDRIESISRHEKILGYLYAAHGAGLAGCFSALKDLEAVHRKELGFFITCFALGFLFTALSHFFRFCGFEMARAMRRDGDTDYNKTRFYEISYLALSFASFLTIAFALCAMIYQFH